jgi:hypothetical protein
MSIEGMLEREFNRWRSCILTYLKINPPCLSMIYSIDATYSECFADTKNLVRVFQIMIDSGELKYNQKNGTFYITMKEEARL